MSAPELDIVRCDVCHVAVTGPRSHCPRCGARSLRPGVVPASGTVLAATELAVPPEGFSAPHRLILLELEEGVRILAQTDGALPAHGEKLRVRRDCGRFWIDR